MSSITAPDASKLFPFVVFVTSLPVRRRRAKTSCRRSSRVEARIFNASPSYPEVWCQLYGIDHAIVSSKSLFFSVQRPFLTIGPAESALRLESHDFGRIGDRRRDGRFLLLIRHRSVIRSFRDWQRSNAQPHGGVERMPRSTLPRATGR